MTQSRQLKCMHSALLQEVEQKYWINCYYLLKSQHFSHSLHSVEDIVHHTNNIIAVLIILISCLVSSVLICIKNGESKAGIQQVCVQRSITKVETKQKEHLQGHKITTGHFFLSFGSLTSDGSATFRFLFSSSYSNFPPLLFSSVSLHPHTSQRHSAYKLMTCSHDVACCEICLVFQRKH